MSATIKDIARIAHVAVGTVSRVINHRPDVDPESRERVERVLQECKYRPSARARNFATGSSTILSYILSNRDFLHPVHSHILQGVEEYCEEADYFVIFTRFLYSPQTRADNIRVPRVLQSHGIADCVILAGENYDNFTKVLEQEGMRYVLLANTFVSKNGREPLDQMGFDEFSGALEATRYLIQLGHKDIWYIGDTNLQWYRVRWQAYTEAMREAGLEPRAQTIGLFNDPFTNGLKSARMIIEGKNPLTAIFAGNDDIAYG
jgi:DNA-binding LacI/PurR family transcriptional regulator